MILKWATKRDVPDIIKTIYDIWLNKEHGSHEDALEVSEGFSYYYRNFESYSEKKIVLAIEGNKIIGLAGILPFPMPNMPNILAAQLNPVGTIAEYRNKGVAKACINFLSDYLIKERYHLFTVAGDPGYYPKLGFNQVFRQYFASLPVQSIDVIASTDKVKIANIDTIYSIVELFNKAPDYNLFKINRNIEWIERKFTHPEILQSITSGKKIPLGTIRLKDTYISFKENTPSGYMIIAGYENSLTIEEIMGYDVVAIKSLLIKAKELAFEHGINRITVNHSVPDCLVSMVLTELGANITVSTLWHLMLKILNPYEFIKNIIGLLEERIKTSQYSRDCVSFILTIGSINIGICVKTSVVNCHIYNDVDVIGKHKLEMSEKSFAKLITGQLSPKELFNLGYIKAADLKYIDVLTGMFPKHYPYIFETDFN